MIVSVLGALIHMLWHPIFPAVAGLWRGSRSTRAALRGMRVGSYAVESCFSFCRSDCIYLSGIDTGLQQ